MIYAGIGSRRTPDDICERMTLWGAYFAAQGFTLRSGGALRADQAFELGCENAAFYRGMRPSPKQIFTAHDVCGPDAVRWIEHAAMFHPAWDKCSHFAKLLHARNSLIMLDRWLDKPVNFVCCWTRDGKATGGTGQALRIAERLKIPVFNWFFDDAETRLRAFIQVSSRKFHVRECT